MPPLLVLTCNVIASVCKNKKAFELELCLKSNWTSAQLPGQEHQVPDGGGGDASTTKPAKVTSPLMAEKRH